jgi:hypothetical protein
MGATTGTRSTGNRRRLGEIWLRGDKNKLMQAIGNVVSNAYKYSPAGGGVEIRLASGGKEGARHTMIAVTDQGIGMATEELSRVGERFYRADKSGKISGHGPGSGDRQGDRRASWWPYHLWQRTRERNDCRHLPAGYRRGYLTQGLSLTEIDCPCLRTGRR